ncbi:Na+/H+ antiporter NhaA [Chitinimonas arctica]|uniref:Na(+)/H(+) antiporter NhaA n=1 Tax=Chitinimonas arctica TaxID=2594795 RepID=A0A516SF39_9NEIS|nr:Na+/H+ antiporter NhaA [Chitinimonas arctica]QDQ26777.1 Na+/H+ antiporter NhaA [Chitinimonas arctica]
MRSSIQQFIQHESSGGVLLMLTTILALVAANSPLAGAYAQLLGIPVAVSLGEFAIAKPLLLWVNDGLMAIFFYLVGLELKRELLEGELADRQRATLPAIAAIGGMLLPALIYLACTYHDSAALRGWAIPAATDIAFALGVLTLLGPRVPMGLKVFLVSLAIIDDLGAVLIIALFYSHGVSPQALLVAVGALALLWQLNRRGVSRGFPYLLVSLVLWVAVLKSGIHATLAGVAAAFFMPLRTRNRHGESPLRALEASLHGPVAFFVLPVFAFFNAGIPLQGLSPANLLEPAPLGIALGLLIGKQLGVLSFAWLAVKSGLGRLPEQVGWREIYGAALLCGIGFTMSLFISGLAFSGDDPHLLVTSRLGILVGSLLSAVAGYLLLARSPRR